MFKKYYILLIVALVAGCALSVQADDDVDDVYYWPDGTQTQEQTLQRPDRLFDEDGEAYDDGVYPEDSYSEEPTYRYIDITFIEDSVTRNSDNTIIKAHIHRY